MLFYVTIGTLQDEIRKARKSANKPVLFSDVLKYIYSEKLFFTERPAPPDTMAFLSVNQEEFVENARSLAYSFRSEDLFSDTDYDIVPEYWDVTTASLFSGTDNSLYESDCFEIDYVLSGECNFRFQNETIILRQGDMCILTPHSPHNVTPADDSSFVVPIYVKEHSFHRTFFHLLPNTDIMSGFFKTVLQNPESHNYLMFSTSNSYEIQTIVRQLFLERFFYDEFSSRSGVHWINLLFIHTLRDYSTYHQFSSNINGLDYTRILKYIEQNYRTITLSELSAHFNYTVPYMSKLIHSITGERFSDLLLKRRMSEAVTLLEETDLSIENIAYKVGYNTTDNFTRSFKKYFKLPPSRYRQHKDS